MGGWGTALALLHPPEAAHCPPTLHLQSRSRTPPSSPPCRFRERLEPFQAHLPEAAERVIEEELEKLQVGRTG